MLSIDTHFRSENRICHRLRRQDSNLNYLNQNQRCCHYTTADCHALRALRPIARKNNRMPTRR